MYIRTFSSTMQIIVGSLLLFMAVVTKADDSSIMCTESYCNKYPGQADPACPTLPSLCNKTKSDSGIFLPSPTPCNCCDFCIAYLSDTCSTGEKTSDSPTEICGPGLYCDQTTEKCRKMTGTLCLNAQAKYDADKAVGKVGDYQVRPSCDGDGYYVPYQCIPGGICYCVDKDGNRIFGSIENNGRAEFDLPCTCSRNFNEMGNIVGRKLRPGEYFRCAQNGAYEPLQCIYDTTCLCVDTMDGAPTYKNAIPVEIYALSNDTLPCFNKTVNMEGKFFRRCEELHMNRTKEIEDKKEDYDKVLAYELPDCTPDGNYAPVQQNITHKYCMTPQGIPLTEYILEKIPSNAKLLSNMNCKCAMALRIMSSEEKPSCLKNGNYNPKQCRRGACYTVDEDGNQIIS
ncbi:uncharacterized protein LOC123307228 isoform X2 [Coccinella septempunctata]|uniref:uncharacterized protein LOC123307228 isoform X2 n=1 Tax=Coccinella septempunctata TaxID=41139 RepID=UPI001D08F7FF|nr:uncharacterized protein LOC123307228 isoform X2 [Coccinella septempunctata]